MNKTKSENENQTSVLYEIDRKTWMPNKSLIHGINWRMFKFDFDSGLSQVKIVMKIWMKGLWKFKNFAFSIHESYTCAGKWKGVKVFLSNTDYHNIALWKGTEMGI